MQRMSSLKRILLFIFISLGLLVLLSGIPAAPASSPQGTLPSSTVSTFPAQIEIECTFTSNLLGDKTTCLVAEWSQSSGSNSSMPIQLSVNESNQTFTVSTLNEYAMKDLTLLITDANGTSGINMLNPGTISITSSDKWSYSPIGTELTDLYSGEYFQVLPGTSGGSLFGLASNPFPPFPTTTYHLLSFYVTVPDIFAIPHWLGEIVIWAFNEMVIAIAIGWEDVIGIPVKYIGEGITYVANLYDGIWNNIYDAFAALPDGLGIFALPVASLAFGVLLFITVASFALIGEGIVKLVSG